MKRYILVYTTLDSDYERVECVKVYENYSVFERNAMLTCFEQDEDILAMYSMDVINPKSYVQYYNIKLENNKLKVVPAEVK